MLTILIVVIVCSLLQTASFKCLPNISDSNKHNNDFGQIECEISTCTSISKIIFERVDINISTPVFMGINKTLYSSIHNEDYEYTLKDRSDYMSFPTKALLYIEPLILEDHGKWRCVVYDSNNRKYESQARDVVIYDIPSEETLHIEPTKTALVTDQIQEFRCTVDRIHPKPDVVWLMNGVTQRGRIDNNTQTDDGYWSVTNTIAVKFHVEGANNLSCVIKTKVILIKNITLDIKASARILDPEIGMLVQEVPFILNCSGSGFKPSLTWKRNGKSISDTNEKYKIQQKCSELKCEGSLSPALIGSMTNNSIIDEYLGVFTCVIELDYPYKSFQESQYMAVYVPQAQCIENTNGYKVGMFVCIAICILQFSILVKEKVRTRHKGTEKEGNKQEAYRMMDSGETTGGRLGETELTGSKKIWQCKPTLTEGTNTELNEGGHVYFECEITSCNSIMKVIFEKTNIYSTTEWIPVFKGINKTHYATIDTGIVYNLDERIEYSAFRNKEQILYIKSLILEDQGNWRCVVHGGNGRKSESEPIGLYFGEKTKSEPTCKPDILEGIKSNTQTNGSLTLVCSTSTCSTVKKLLYEKKGIEHPLKWTPVFEGLHKNYRALYTGTSYNVNRSGIAYTNLSKRHFLIISPLILEDTGEWRCVAYDNNNVTYPSQPLNINIHGSKVDIPNIRVHDKALVTGQSSEFTCIADGMYPEPVIMWILNGSEHGQGKAANIWRSDGLLTVKNTIRLSFNREGVHILRCVMNTQSRKPWLENDVIINVKESARVSEPQVEINIRSDVDSSFTLNCSGTGFNPFISWIKDGTRILDNDSRYMTEQNCTGSICVGSLTSSPMDSYLACITLDEYYAVFACVISLEPPYKSSQSSPYIHVYQSTKPCKGIIRWTIICSAVLIVVLVVTALSISRILRCQREKRQQEVEGNAEYAEIDDSLMTTSVSSRISDRPGTTQEYDEIQDMVANPRPLTRPTNTIRDQFIHCRMAGSDQVTEQSLNNEDVAVYKIMNRQGRATYVTKEDMVTVDYVSMDKDVRATYESKENLNHSEYMQMEHHEKLEDNLEINDGEQMAGQDDPTYINNEISVNKPRRKYSGILIEKPDFDILCNASSLKDVYNNC